jgi:hypothetical protein
MSGLPAAIRAGQQGTQGFFGLGNASERPPLEPVKSGVGSKESEKAAFGHQNSSSAFRKFDDI